MSFEAFVALRYLRPRRGRGAISVVTAIAIGGFAAGVGALVLALAITNGFRDTLQQELVGATAHLNLLRSSPEPFAGYRDLMERLRRLPQVRAAAPVVYDEAFLSHQDRAAEATLKGVVPQEELQVGDLLRHLVAGTWLPLQTQPLEPNLVLGKDLADQLGVGVGDHIEVYIPRAVITPLGYAGRTYPFRVAGIFATGFGDFDGRWAYTSFQTAQALTPGNGDSDTASVIEMRLVDLYQAEAVATQVEKLAGPGFTTTTWMGQNRAVFQALKLERLGTILVIGLIVLVAALNVLIMLSMLVLEKKREIAVLLSLGARRRQIQRIFIYQGLWIAGFGTLFGMGFAYVLAWAANRYRWIPLSNDVYPVSYVPFHAHAADGFWVAGVALGLSLLATLYPAHGATRLAPAEALRYE
ncbi:MAG: ABC transporter permease [Terriglobales bacterium]